MHFASFVHPLFDGKRHQIIRLTVGGLPMRGAIHGGDCARDIHFGRGPFTEEQIVLGFKRWFVLGHPEAPRTDHVHGFIDPRGSQFDVMKLIHNQTSGEQLAFVFECQFSSADLIGV